FDDEVRVQIKGHIDDPAKNKSGKQEYLGRQRITYPVDLIDLEIYSKGGGVIYFEIFMSPDGEEKEVFYASLYPSVLKKYKEKKNPPTVLQYGRGIHFFVNVDFLHLFAYRRYSICRNFFQYTLTI
ncbi:MAG: hypothetical protein HFI37_07375, partial [Lachnospiraceae bacterium]|nr:hypothetical protein [Lachnospiraceae bacterium]